MYTFGDLTPIIPIQNIYYGPHGSVKYNAIVKLVVVKAIFVVKQSNIPNFPEGTECRKKFNRMKRQKDNDSDLERETKTYKK